MMSDDISIATRIDIQQLGLHKFLGPLETVIMRSVWAGNDSKRTIYRSLVVDGSQLAYPTVSTVINRLVVKGLLIHDQRNRRYTPTHATEMQYTRKLLTELVATLYSDYGALFRQICNEVIP